MKRTRTKRTIRTATLTAGALILSLGLPTAPVRADDGTPRIDLRVLIVSDGGPATDAIAAELDGAGTPYTVVELGSPDRPAIDADFLAGTIDGRPHARYQAVVLPNDNPFPAGSGEMAALVSYEKTYAIPQVDAYTYARPQAGLEYPVNGGYAGPVDGIGAEVTAAGKAGPFGYLDGSFTFEDNDPSVDESWGFLSRPRPGADFTTYVDAQMPGGTARGSLVGEYRHDGRRELVVTFVSNRYQQQFRLLARGIVDWMTQGVRLGSSRNYFSVHVDDVFASDDRWDTALNCTPGDVDCQPGQGTPNPIRMTPDDVRHAVAWSRSRGFTLDFAFNGGGSVEYREEHGGADPLADALTTDRDAFRWINHTYDHPFLGCEQNVTVVPWKCATNPDGSTRYVSRDEISRQIADNHRWAQQAGLPLETGELVTGEHSGLKLTPQQPDDNPNLAPALADNGIAWLGSDNSRDPQQRRVGPALTVSRYPMNVFYNVGRAAEQVDEYNWIYTSRAQGGSGICEGSVTTTCLDAPLDTATGYTDHIVPLETRIAMGHVLANDPRPHFIHQSNLAEDRIAYPVLDGILDQYAALYADSTPLVSLRMKDIGTELRERAAWNDAVKAGQVTGYRIGDSVNVTAPEGVAVSATMPAGTTRTLPDGAADFGQAYAGTVFGRVSPATGQDGVTLTLPAAPAAGSGVDGGAARTTAPAPDAPVPAEVERRVPPGDDRRH